MGTVSKVARVRKAKKKNGNGHTGAAARKKIDDLYDALSDVLDTYGSLVESINPKDHVTQEQMQAAYTLEHIIKVAEGARKAFDARMLAHQGKNGHFEAGQVAITFPETGGKRTPKWKQEAIDHARFLAAATDNDFDEEAFVVSVTERTEPSAVKNKVKLVMSAD